MEMIHILKISFVIFCSISCISSTPASERTKIQPQLITEGTNLFWGFTRGDETYFMTSELVATEDPSTGLRGRFNVSTTDDGLTTVALDDLFVGISPTGLLIALPTIATKFNLIPSEDSDSDQFHLAYDGELLVTRNSRPPFQFYLQSVYPGELAALFHLEGTQLDIDGIYQGARENINKTLEAIRDSPNVDFTQAYDTLLDLMEHYGHLPGKEIFRVASFIHTDLGPESSTFDRLPYPVQVVTAEQMVTISYRTSLNSYVLKNNVSTRAKTASYPFILTYIDSGFWSLVYNFDNYLYPEVFGNRRLLSSTNVTSPFELHLGPALNTTHIVHPTYGYMFATSCSGDTCSFAFNLNPSARANITFKPFDLKVADMYTTNDVADLGYLIHVVENSTLIKESLYTEVARQVGKRYFGKQVLTLAYYIQKDLGCDSGVFTWLAETMRLLVCNKPLTFLYSRETNYKMKYSWASDMHQNVLPYQFALLPTFTYFGTPAGIHVSLVYADEFYLFMDEESGLLVDGRGDGEANFDFEIEFTSGSPDYNEFRLEILATPMKFLRPTTQTPDFYFDGNATGGFNAKFYVKEYSLIAECIGLE